ncbi:hypothetical protein TH30_19540 [Thalassospira profundimaris]|uniref:Uncharacterized protein n=1 Tax=Thalassospira profundimaris TaxID=502049 RepID=A0A367WRZ2_9PROT|nr:hypothetical protein TH30_19540 [Thalassospira profundimaris]
MIDRVSVLILTSVSIGNLLMPHNAKLLGATGLVWCIFLAGRTVLYRSRDVKKRIRDGDSPSFLFRISFDTKKD